MMAKPCSFGTFIFLTYAFLCFLHSVTPKEMADEQENDSVPIGEEMHLKKCSEDDLEGCMDTVRVGRRDTASESERRVIDCGKRNKPVICKVFLGRKRRLSRGASSFPETLSRRDGVANPLIRALRSKFCSGDKPDIAMCRGPTGGKKKYLRETAVPEWKLDAKSDDPSKGKCDPWEIFCHGKRTVPTAVECNEDEESFNPVCRWPIPGGK